LDKSKIKKILVISLSNIGDCILTFPVVDILFRDFPRSKISIVTGPKAAALVEGNSHFENCFIYDKHQVFVKTLIWLMRLRKEKYDLVIDLRNTAIPILIGARQRNSLWLNKSTYEHMKDKHLMRLRSVYTFSSESEKKYSIEVSK